jgi:hypothetical protein
MPFRRFSHRSMVVKLVTRLILRVAGDAPRVRLAPPQEATS